MNPHESLLSELKEKHRESDTTGFDVLDFLGAYGSPLDALMYMGLLWPQFTEFEGMIFRQETLEDEEDRTRVLEALRRYGGDESKTERSFNILDVPCGAFSRFAHESSDELDRLLAEGLVEMWQCRLAMLFPHRTFLVEMVDPKENGGDRAILFYTSR
jgi:hypothetical protein